MYLPDMARRRADAGATGLESCDCLGKKRSLEGATNQFTSLSECHVFVLRESEVGAETKSCAGVSGSRNGARAGREHLVNAPGILVREESVGSRSLEEWCHREGSSGEAGQRLVPSALKLVERVALQDLHHTLL